MSLDSPPPPPPPEVPPAAAAAYLDAQSVLIAHVDRALADRAEHRALIGDNPLRMMFDNHRNHASFIGSVVVLGRYSLLERTIPWVYRAYLAQGFDARYFLVELEAWREALRQHLPADQVAPLHALYGWMLEHHDRWIAAASAPPEPELVGDPAWDEDRRRFFDAIVSGDVRSAWATLRASAADDDLPRLFEEVLRLAMYEVGARWEVGELSPAIEHRATAVALRALSALQLLRPAPAPSAQHAVVASAPNEHHELGGHALALSLEAAGWQTSCLGANTPAEDIVGLVTELRPRLLAISVTMPYHLDGARELIAAVRQGPSGDFTRVMVGGHGFRQLPELAHTLGAHAAPDSLREAVELAERWARE